MWPFAAQSPSKCGDLAGMRMYSSSWGTISSSQARWQKSRGRRGRARPGHPPSWPWWACPWRHDGADAVPSAPRTAESDPTKPLRSGAGALVPVLAGLGTIAAYPDGTQVSAWNLIQYCSIPSLTPYRSVAPAGCGGRWHGPPRTAVSLRSNDESRGHRVRQARRLGAGGESACRREPERVSSPPRRRRVVRAAMLAASRP